MCYKISWPWERLCQWMNMFSQGYSVRKRMQLFPLFSVSLGCSWVQVQNLLFFRHQRRHLMSNDCPKTKRTMAKLLGVFLHYTPNSDRDMVKNRFPFKDKCSFIWTYFKTEISLKLDSWVYFRREGFSFYSKWNILIQFLRSLDFCKIKL